MRRVGDGCGEAAEVYVGLADAHDAACAVTALREVARALERVLHAQQQLAEHVRNRQQLVQVRVVRRQEHHCGARALLAQRARDVETAAVGQADVQQRNVEMIGRERAARRGDGRGVADGIAVGAQPLRERVGDVGIILHHQ